MLKFTHTAAKARGVGLGLSAVCDVTGPLVFHSGIIQIVRVSECRVALRGLQKIDYIPQPLEDWWTQSGEARGVIMSSNRVMTAKPAALLVGRCPPPSHSRSTEVRVWAIATLRASSGRRLVGTDLGR